MNRRTAHTTTKTATRTGGEDAPRVPCAAYPHVYDAIGDPTHGDRGRAADEAREAARNLCATHLLRDPKAARACLSAAVANGERWALVVTRPQPPEEPQPRKARPRKLLACGTYGAYRRHLRLGEDACEPCLAANRAHSQKQRDKRKGDAA